MMYASHGAVDSKAASTAISATTDDPLDICLLSYRSDPYSGGQGVYVDHLSRELVAAGHRVDVISGPPYPTLDSRVDLVKLPGADVFAAENPVAAFRPEFLAEPTKLYEWTSAITGGFPEPYAFGRRVVHHFESRAPDYDVIHDNQSLSYGLLTLARRGYPVVATVHHPITVDRELALEHADGLLARSGVRRWYSFVRMQAAVARQLPHVIVVSEASKRRAIEDFGITPETATVIHNGVDTDRYAPVERDPVPGRIVTTISSDVPLKGLRYLLRAFAHVHQAAPQTELHVMGDFDDDGQTGRLVGRLGIESAIDWRGRVDDEEMVAIYASAALAVVPSLFEGFGLPAAEAMACGVPLVATTGGGLPEVVGDAGLLVPPRDVEALVRGIRRLLAEPTRRSELGAAARDRIETAFDWAATARETAACYRRAIAEVTG